MHRRRPAGAPERRTARPPQAPAARRGSEPVVRAARWSRSRDARSCLGSGHRQPLSPGGALRRRQQVRGEQLRRVRDAAAPRDAAHIHDVRLPFALDDVDAVEVDAESPAAAPRDLAQLRTGCERLPATYVAGVGTPAICRILLVTILSRSATVTG